MRRELNDRRSERGARGAILSTLGLSSHHERGVGNNADDEDVDGGSGAGAFCMCVPERQQVLERTAAMVMVVFTNVVQRFGRRSRARLDRRLRVRDAQLDPAVAGPLGSGQPTKPDRDDREEYD